MRQKLGFALRAGVGLLALGAAGCLPSIADLDSGPLTETFAVSDYFTPSGFMGDGQYFGKLVVSTNQNCKPRPNGARGNCYAFTYYPNQIDENPWAGVFWVFPANSWGSTYGHAIDMSKFKQVSFYAAIDGPTPYTNGGNPERFNAIIGGIDPKGGFSSKKPGAKDYLDGVNAASSAPIGGDDGVTSTMKQFHVALTDFAKGSGCIIPGDPDKAENCVDSVDAMGQPIRIANDLIGAFAWSLHYPNDVVTCRPPVDTSLPADWCHRDQHSSQFVNPPPVTIYLDDIVWETQ